MLLRTSAKLKGSQVAKPVPVVFREVDGSRVAVFEPDANEAERLKLIEEFGSLDRARAHADAVERKRLELAQRQERVRQRLELARQQQEARDQRQQQREQRALAAAEAKAQRAAKAQQARALRQSRPRTAGTTRRTLEPGELSPAAARRAAQQQRSAEIEAAIRAADKSAHEQFRQRFESSLQRLAKRNAA